MSSVIETWKPYHCAVKNDIFPEILQSCSFLSLRHGHIMERWHQGHACGWLQGNFREADAGSEALMTRIRVVIKPMALLRIKQR